MRRTLLLVALCLWFGAAAAQTVIPGQNVTGSYAIYQDYPATPLTGTTSETNLAAIRVPANSLGPKGLVRVNILFSYTNNANTKTLTLRWTAGSAATSGGLIGANPVTASADGNLLFIIRNAGATNAQIATVGGNGATPYGVLAAALVTNTVDTTADSFLNINGTLGVGTDTITLLGYSVEILRP